MLLRRHDLWVSARLVTGDGRVGFGARCWVMLPGWRGYCARLRKRNSYAVFGMSGRDGRGIEIEPKSRASAFRNFHDRAGR
jgi:hypothetical protein